MSCHENHQKAGPKKSTFFALSAAAFVSGLNIRLFDVLLPNVADDFAVDPTRAAIVVTAFTLAYGIFQLVFGPLGDRFGKLQVIMIAALATALGSLGSGFAGSLSSLAWLRAATGLGAAAIFPVSLAWLGESSRFEDRQATLGRFIAFLLLGQVLSPAFGGLLAQFMSWREVFFALAAVFLLVALALSREARIVPSSPRIPDQESVVRTYLKVLRLPWVRTIVLTTTIEGFFFFGAFAYAGVFLKERFALSYAGTGAIMACYGLGAFAYSLSIPRLLRKMNQTGFVRLGGTALLLCFTLLPWVPVWPAALPLIAASGFGFYMLHNTLQTIATEMAAFARGTGIALFAFGLFIGQAAGVSALGGLIHAAGYTPAFTASGLLLFLLSRWFAPKLAARSLPR